MEDDDEMDPSQFLARENDDDEGGVSGSGGGASSGGGAGGGGGGPPILTSLGLTHINHVNPYSFLVSKVFNPISRSNLTLPFNTGNEKSFPDKVLGKRWRGFNKKESKLRGQYQARGSGESEIRKNKRHEGCEVSRSLNFQIIKILPFGQCKSLNFLLFHSYLPVC